jgi:hypothetical protein
MCTQDAFVAKLSSDGSTLLYSRYLGGAGMEAGYGVAVDSNGNAYVHGGTWSTDFPTTPGAYQTQRCKSVLTVTLLCSNEQEDEVEARLASNSW